MNDISFKYTCKRLSSIVRHECKNVTQACHVARRAANALGVLRRGQRTTKFAILVHLTLPPRPPPQSFPMATLALSPAGAAG